MRRLLRHPLSWIFFLGLGLRFVNLTYHSLWFDEVISTVWAAQPVGEIWRVGMALVQDKHPPFYYLLLHGWTSLVGGSDFGVRSLGAAIGAFAVFPVYGIGRRLGGMRAGAFAALLLALNPFLVWYSQEARMFMPATTFAVTGLYGVLQVAHGEWRTPGHRHPRLASTFYPLLTIGGFTAALYSYLYSAFLMPVAAAWLLVARWESRREPGAQRDFWLGVLALTAVSLLFLPVAWSAWRVSGAEAVAGKPFAGMLPALAALLKTYTFGWPSWGAGWMTALALGAGTLALAGCVVPSPERRRGGGLYLIIWLAVVILIGGVLLGRDGRVFAESRYQIALAPALCLAWGRTLSLLWAWRKSAGLTATALAVAVTTAALPYDWSPQNRREAWREAAAFVATHAGPNDAILIQADYVHVAFLRYFRGTQGRFFPFTDKLSDPAQVDAPLAGLAGFDAVWVVQSHHQELDPDDLVLGWFAARYPLTTEVFPPGIAIHAFDQHYRVAELPGNALPAQGFPPLGGLQPLICRYQPAALSPHDDLFHPPSAWIHVTSYWRASDPPPVSDLRPRFRVVDAAGQVWGESMTRQNDAFGVWPPSRWVLGEIVRAGHDINLNPDTPVGTYRLILEVPDADGQAVCGQVKIR
jgi:4-amino-4-deoxy-L-arabinose transferase-like glycosyltransferase